MFCASPASVSMSNCVLLLPHPSPDINVCMCAVGLQHWVATARKAMPSMACQPTCSMRTPIQVSATDYEVLHVACRAAFHLSSARALFDALPYHKDLVPHWQAHCLAGSHGGSGGRGSLGPTPTPTPPPRTPPLGHAQSLGAPGPGHNQHSQLAANAAIAAALQVGNGLCCVC